MARPLCGLSRWAVVSGEDGPRCDQGSRGLKSGALVFGVAQAYTSVQSGLPESNYQVRITRDTGKAGDMTMMQTSMEQSLDYYLVGGFRISSAGRA